MRLQEGIRTYLEELAERGYARSDMPHRTTLLRRHLSYALALHHPALLLWLREARVIRLYSRGTVSEEMTRERRDAAEHFLAVLRDKNAEGISFLALGPYLEDYTEEYLVDPPDAAMRRRAIDDLCRALGLEIELQTVERRTYGQIIDYLSDHGVSRAADYSVAFFRHCSEAGRLSFEPPRQLRRPHRKVLDPDFLGGQEGLWTKRLRGYLEHLKNEGNLNDGSIASYVCTLRVFTRWLDARGAGQRVGPKMVKEFLAEREKLGVKAITSAKYVYSVRYFFDYLLSRGLGKANPAKDLHVRADPSPEGPVLTELEVLQVIDHLENQVFAGQDAPDVPQQMRGFRASRDLGLFLLFCLTGVRLAEACGMTLEDLDFTKRAVRIKAKGNRSRRKKHREILLPDALWSRLTRYLAAHHHRGGGPLWISWSGRPMSGSGVNRMIVTRVREAGVAKHISPHRLRATCTSLYVKGGMDPFSLKTLLGHESITTTMDHYVRLTEEELREVWKRANPLAGTDEE